MKIFDLVGNSGLRRHSGQPNYEIKNHRDKIRVEINSPIHLTVEPDQAAWPEVESFLDAIKPPAG